MQNKIIQTMLLTILVLFAVNIQANQYQSQYYPNQAKAHHVNRYGQQQLQSQQKSPVVILERSIDNVLDFLAQSDSENIKQLRDYVNQEIAPNFDFNYMSKWVAGRRYEMMNENQQVEFTNKFTDVFLSTFIEKITKNRQHLPRVNRFMSKRQNQNEARASVMLDYSNRTQVWVEFRFLNTANGWKVVDIKANGISALMYFRNYFAHLMREKSLN